MPIIRTTVTRLALAAVGAALLPAGGALGGVTPTLPNPPGVVTPAQMTGHPIVGTLLRCRATFDAPGLREFRWLRDGVEIPGATLAAYRIRRSDLNAGLSCRVTAFSSGGNTPSTSPAALIPALCVIPRVRSKPESVARSLIQRRGCRVRVELVASLAAPRGRAVGTEPRQGSRRPNGTVITLRVRR